MKVRLRITEWDEDGEPASLAYPSKIVNGTMTTDDDSPRYDCDSCDEELEKAMNLGMPPVSDSAENV